jgi:hypothetical protein
MRSRHLFFRTLFVSLFFAATLPTMAQSAYLPGKGTLDVSPNVLYYEFTEFVVGGEVGAFWKGTFRELGRDPVDQGFQDPIKYYYIGVAMDYGVTETLAIDANFGYAYSTFRGQDRLDGLADSQLGLRLQLVDEAQFTSGALPSLALRVGAIIEGTYETFADGTFNALGDGASGGEISLLIGKAFGNSGFGLYGDVGYRNRLEGVPEDIFGSLGFYKTIRRGLTIRVGAKAVYALSGVDLFEENFRFDDLPEAKERALNAELGIGYTDSRGIYYQIYGARTIWGENTREASYLGASISLPLGRRPFVDGEVLPDPQKSGAKR